MLVRIGGNTAGSIGRAAGARCYWRRVFVSALFSLGLHRQVGWGMPGLSVISQVRFLAAVLRLCVQFS